MADEIVKMEPCERLIDNWAATQLTELAAGKNEKTRGALLREIYQMATDLAGPDPSPVERVLAETAATSWFAFRTHEAKYIGSLIGGGMSLAQSEHSQRRLDRAHRRFLTTIKALAAVRRLAIPALQVNIARHQQIAQLNGDARHETG